MKRLKYLLFLLLTVSVVFEVQAKSCTIHFFTYFAGDYSDVPYCDGRYLNTCTTPSGKSGSPKNLCSSGCYPLSIASILKSYGEDVNPRQIAQWLCDNNNGFRGRANTVQYGNISRSPNFHSAFHMDMTQLPNQTLSYVDEALSEGYMVLASISGASNWSGSGGHYIAIAAKRDEEYFIINTATRDPSAPKYSKWFSKSDVLAQAVNTKGSYWWKIKPSECDEVKVDYSETTLTEESPTPSEENSNEENSGSTSDEHENIFPNIEGKGCGTILINCDGNPTELNHILNDVFFVIKLATPILVIVLSTIDYIKALVSSNADEIKKTNKRTVMRVVIGLIVFFLPYLLELIFHLFGLYDINIGGIG